MSCGELLPINAVCLEESVVNQGNKPQSWRRRACCTQRHVAKKPSGVISSLQWPHKSGLQAVGGADFSSIQRHLMLVAVYLARSHADAKWCQHLFVLPFGGSWSFFCLFMAQHARCHFLLLSQQPAYLFWSVFSGYCTLSFSGSLSLCCFFSHLACPISAKMCTFTWINRLFKPKQPSVQKDGQFSSYSSLKYVQQERDAGLENSAFYFHAHALEVLLKWIFFIL